MTRLLPLLLILSCTDPHYLDTPEIPDTVPYCQQYGTGKMTAFDYTGANITLQLTRHDTNRYELANGQYKVWDSIPAGWIGMRVFTKWGNGIYVLRLDTCQVFKCSIRVIDKQIKIKKL